MAHKFNGLNLFSSLQNGKQLFSIKLSCLFEYFFEASPIFAFKIQTTCNKQSCSVYKQCEGLVGDAT